MNRTKLILTALLLGCTAGLVAEVRIISTDASPYKVYVDGEVVSEHTTQHKAIQRALKAVEGQSGSTVRVRRNLELRFERTGDESGETGGSDGGGTDDGSGGTGETTEPSEPDETDPTAPPPAPTAEVPSVEDLEAQGYAIRRVGDSDQADARLGDLDLPKDLNWPNGQPRALLLEDQDHVSTRALRVSGVGDDPGWLMPVSGRPVIRGGVKTLGVQGLMRMARLRIEGKLWLAAWSGQTGLVVDDVVVTGGIHAEGNNAGWLKNVTMRNVRGFNGPQGIFAKKSEAVRLTGCWFDKSGASSSRDHGLYLAWARDWVIEDSAITRSTSAGVKIQAADDVTFRNCLFADNHQGASVNSNNQPTKAPDGIDAIDAERIRFEDCVFIGQSATDVILGWSLDGAVFERCLFLSDSPVDAMRFRQAFQAPELAHPIRNVRFTDCVWTRPKAEHLIWFVNPGWSAENVTVQGTAYGVDKLARSPGNNQGVTLDVELKPMPDGAIWRTPSDLYDRLGTEPVGEVVQQTIDEARAAYGVE